MIINYWFKILEYEPINHIKYAYNLMLTGIENTSHCVNWASQLRDMILNLWLYGVWLNQGIGNKDMF